MSKSKKQYNPGKLWPIVKIVAGLVRDNPKLLDNPDYLHATLKANIEELNHKETCPNCGASMLEYVFEFDVLDALLLLAMGRMVNENYIAYTSNSPMCDMQHAFTQANIVHVPSLATTLAIRCRTTQCSKLGLIAKYTPNGTHVPGMWVITKRGFDALKGRAVPKSVRVWRGKIEERHEGTVTMQELFTGHTDKVREIIKKKKEPKKDYRDQYASYEPKEWYHVGGVHEGKLF